MVMMKIDRPGAIKLPPRPLPFPQPLPFPGHPPVDPVDQATFALLDGDGDGKVSGDEWKRAGWTADRLADFDADGDGAVSAREFQDARRFEREFNAKDRNGDGKLSRHEFLGIWFEKLQATPLVAKLTGAKAVLGGGEKAVGIKPAPRDLHITPPGTWQDRFSRADQDGDGAVSKSEYIAARRKETTPVVKPWPPIQWPVLADAKPTDKAE